MDKKLLGKTALITGGNSGIGLACAKLFHQEGAKVIITGRREEQVAVATREIGEGTLGVTSDTADLSDIKALYEKIGQTYGILDILFLNAGIARFEPIEMVTEETFDLMASVNFKGLYFNIQQAVPLMKNGGSIILTTSAAGSIGAPNMSAYGATKAAARSLARTLSAELIPKGIRVNGISPGPVDTPIMEKVGIPPEALDAAKEGFAEGNPMKRLGTVEEIASGALFLASDDSSYVAGIDLAIDGGLSQF